MKLKIVLHGNAHELDVHFNKYSINGACAVELFEDNEPFCYVTTNIPDHWKEIWKGTPSEGQYPKFPYIIIKDYSENEGMADALEGAGFITGHVRLAQCMFKLAKLTDVWIAEAVKSKSFKGYKG